MNTPAPHSLLHAAKMGNACAVQEILSSTRPSSEAIAAALCASARAGRLEIIRLLFGRVQVYDSQVRQALVAASGAGHLDVVRELLVFRDPDGSALGAAVRGGHVEVARALLPISNPQTERAYPIRVAAALGHADLVALLLPVSGRLGAVWALGEACKREALSVIEMLVPQMSAQDIDDALFEEAREGRLAVVEHLLAGPTTQSGLSAALTAALNTAKHPSVMALLMEHSPAPERDRLLGVFLSEGDLRRAVLLSTYVSVACLQTLPGEMYTRMPRAHRRRLEEAFPEPRCVVQGKPRL